MEDARRRNTPTMSATYATTTTTVPAPTTEGGMRASTEVFSVDAIEICRRILTTTRNIIAILPLSNINIVQDPKDNQGGASDGVWMKSRPGENISLTELREGHKQLTNDCDTLCQMVGDRVPASDLVHTRYSRSKEAIFLGVLNETCGTLRFHVNTFIAQSGQVVSKQNAAGAGGGEGGIELDIEGTFICISNDIQAILSDLENLYLYKAELDEELFGSLGATTSTTTTPHTSASVVGVATYKKPHRWDRVPAGYQPPSHEQAVRVQKIARHWLFKRRSKRIGAIVGHLEECKEQKVRNEVLREIVDTERRYVGALSALLEFYARPLNEKAQQEQREIDEAKKKDAGSSIMALPGVTNIFRGDKARVFKKEEISVIFKGMDAIHHLSQDLLLRLEERMAQWPNQIFADIFLTLAPMMKMYTTLVSQFDQSQAACERCQQSPEFQVFLDECKAKSGVQNDIYSLLIMPVQRMPRYALLLKELAKHTAEDHKDHQNVKQALTLYTDMNAVINESRREFERRGKLYELQNLITGCPPLISRRGKLTFIKRGDVVMDSNKTLWRKKRVIFVFSEFALITRADLSFKWRIDYTQMRLAAFSDAAVSREDHYGLELTNDNVHSKNWKFYFRTEEERNEWMQEFERIIKTFNIRVMCDDLLQKKKQKAELQVRVIAARNLLAADMTGLSDSFVVLKLGEQELKSGTIFKSLNPLWNEFFNFAVENPDGDVLTIEVWDYSRRSTPRFMGSTSVRLADIKHNFLEGVEMEQWLILTIDEKNFEELQKSNSYLPTNYLQQMANKNRDKNNVGQIVISITPTGFGLVEPPAGALLIEAPHDYNKIWGDTGTGVKYGDMTIFRPVGNDSPRHYLYRPVGDLAIPYKANTLDMIDVQFDVRHNTTYLLATKNDPRFLKSPIDFIPVWDSSKTKAYHPCTLWRPIAPFGYVALGYLATDNNKPNTDAMWCVHVSLVIPAAFTHENKGPCIWADKRSGAKNDISLWNIAFADAILSQADTKKKKNNKKEDTNSKKKEKEKETEEIEGFELLGDEEEEQKVLKVATWVAVEQHQKPFVKAFFIRRRSVANL